MRKIPQQSHQSQKSIHKFKTYAKFEGSRILFLRSIIYNDPEYFNQIFLCMQIIIFALEVVEIN